MYPFSPSRQRGETDILLPEVQAARPVAVLPPDAALLPHAALSTTAFFPVGIAHPSLNERPANTLDSAYSIPVDEMSATGPQMHYAQAPRHLSFSSSTPSAPSLGKPLLWQTRTEAQAVGPFFNSRDYECKPGSSETMKELHSCTVPPPSVFHANPVSTFAASANVHGAQARPLMPFLPIAPTSPNSPTSPTSPTAPTASALSPRHQTKHNFKHVEHVFPHPPNHTYPSPPPHLSWVSQSTPVYYSNPHHYCYTAGPYQYYPYHPISHPQASAVVRIYGQEVDKQSSQHKVLDRKEPQEVKQTAPPRVEKSQKDETLSRPNEAVTRFETQNQQAASTEDRHDSKQRPARVDESLSQDIRVQTEQEVRNHVWSEERAITSFEGRQQNAQPCNSDHTTYPDSSTRSNPQAPVFPKSSANSEVKKPVAVQTETMPANESSATDPPTRAIDTVRRKPRKPYTVTKVREIWSHEEHHRFVHALQIYDRNWKMIEAYVGTKTVLQIRSHAQKHFAKVTKHNTGEYIPPARPKRRSVLLYAPSIDHQNSYHGTESRGNTAKQGSIQIAPNQSSDMISNMTCRHEYSELTKKCHSNVQDGDLVRRNCDHHSTLTGNCQSSKDDTEPQKNKCSSANSLSIANGRACRINSDASTGYDSGSANDVGQCSSSRSRPHQESSLELRYENGDTKINARAKSVQATTSDSRVQATKYPSCIGNRKQSAMANTEETIASQEGDVSFEYAEQRDPLSCSSSGCKGGPESLHDVTEGQSRAKSNLQNPHAGAEYGHEKERSDSICNSFDKGVGRTGKESCGIVKGRKDSHAGKASHISGRYSMETGAKDVENEHKNGSSVILASQKSVSGDHVRHDSTENDGNERIRPLKSERDVSNLVSQNSGSALVPGAERGEKAVDDTERTAVTELRPRMRKPTISVLKTLRTPENARVEIESRQLMHHSPHARQSVATLSEDLHARLQCVIPRSQHEQSHYSRALPGPTHTEIQTFMSSVPSDPPCAHLGWPSGSHRASFGNCTCSYEHCISGRAAAHPYLVSTPFVGHSNYAPFVLQRGSLQGNESRLAYEHVQPFFRTRSSTESPRFKQGAACSSAEDDDIITVRAKRRSNVSDFASGDGTAYSDRTLSKQNNLETSLLGIGGPNVTSRRPPVAAVRRAYRARILKQRKQQTTCREEGMISSDGDSLPIDCTSKAASRADESTCSSHERSRENVATVVWNSGCAAVDSVRDNTAKSDRESPEDEQCASSSAKRSSSGSKLYLANTSAVCSKKSIAQPLHSGRTAEVNDALPNCNPSNDRSDSSMPDEAIAGYSGSDRPCDCDGEVEGGSCCASNGGSDNSDYGGSAENGREDPNSSHEGSGDDVNRSGGTSDGDPNSSGSREDSPLGNAECVVPEQVVACSDQNEKSRSDTREEKHIDLILSNVDTLATTPVQEMYVRNDLTSSHARNKLPDSRVSSATDNLCSTNEPIVSTNEKLYRESSRLLAQSLSALKDGGREVFDLSGPELKRQRSPSPILDGCHGEAGNSSMCHRRRQRLKRER